MKNIITLTLTLLTTLGAGAQSKLSSQITDMLNSVSQQIAYAHQGQVMSKSAMSATADVCPVDTAAILDNMVASFNADGTVNTVDVIAWLAEGASCPTSALTSRGIIVNDEALGAVFLTVPVEQLDFLETLEEFTTLNANSVNHINNDRSRTLINVSKVNGIDNETYTFDKPYTGKGVVVGVIDTSIDYNHIAFMDSDGNSRVKKVVDYSTGTENVVTSPEAIAALTWDKYSGSDDKSHGTHVACSAAGSYIASTVNYSPYSRNLMGMAPEADLVLCGLTSLYDARILKATQAIVATAKELGEPCVINMSFGTSGGWHDGKTNINSAIDAVAGKGVIVCMSTANDAIYKWNVDKTIPTDGDMKIVLSKTGSVSSSETIYIPAQTLTFYVPNCTNTSHVTPSFEVVDSLTGAYTTLATSPLKNTSGTTYTPSLSFSKDASHGGWLKASLSLPKTYFESNSKFLVIKVHNASGADLRVYATSSEKNRNDFLFTDIPSYDYDKGTADISINNSCSAENFISVGAYNQSRSFKSYAGNSYSFSIAQAGDKNCTAIFSSYGKDDHGKAHPDVIAPGVAVTSAYNYYNPTYVDATSSDWVSTLKGNGTALIAAYHTDDANGKNHFWYVTNGTSMATPITTGTVALWLQAYPDLTPNDVRNVIVQTSRTSVDGADIKISAGNTEQNYLQLGNGLIDAEAGLQYVIDNYVTPTGVRTVSDGANKASSVTKKLINGNIIIHKNGKYYSTAGQIIK